MGELTTMTYEVDGPIARITLNRPERGNGIVLETAPELAECVERADLDPAVHVIALAGNGKGFCGGYDLGAAESMAAVSAGGGVEAVGGGAPSGSPLDVATVAANHDPNLTWDPITDFQMMRRNARGFMSLFWADKPVVCKVQGFCIAGGTDMALCSDLLVIAEDARIGYPPARVWGVPTTALWLARIGPARAKQMLLTGDLIEGRQALEWGLAMAAPPAADLDEEFERAIGRIAQVPINQLVMHKLLVNQQVAAQGLVPTQALGVLMDGIARHTPEGYEFQRRAGEAGFKQAVRERDEPFE